MDDPWGSPWADEHNNAGVPVKVDVQPVPLVKSVLPESKEPPSSPWGESDDGFGDWASMPADVVLSTGGIDTGASSYTWDIADKVMVQGKLDGLNGHSQSWKYPVGVDERTETSRLSPREPSQSVRGSSPDPWATRLADNIADNDTAHEEDVEEPVVPDHEVDSDDTVAVEPPMLASTKLSSSVPDNKELDETAIVVQPEEHIIEPMERSNSIDGKMAEQTEDLEVTIQRQDIDLESSRPSTSPSDSPHDGIPDSPRTSLDEDIKRPQMPKQASSKVHDLVDHFDKLAKAETAENVVIDAEVYNDNGSSTHEHNIQSSGTHKEGVEDDEDCDDFGDFEEGTSQLGDEDPPTTPILSKQQLQEAPIPTNPDFRSSSSSLPAKTPRKEAVRTDFGRVEFAVGDSFVAELFPGAGDEKPAKIFIPDTIPHDSFSSVEQRKSWYRVSRYGTMKRHDMGDDENYVRTTWTQSQARAGTLKIVARWMEEDRISGRVVLGGGSKGSSLFGWNDDSAGPVPLASAFAQRTQKKFQIQAAPVVEPEIPREWPKGLVKPRSSSNPRSSSKPRRRSSVKSSKGSVDIRPEASVPVASFGWSSESQNSRHHTSALSSEIPASTQRRQSVPRHQTAVLSGIAVPANLGEEKQVIHINGRNVLSPIMQTPVTAGIEGPPGIIPLVSNSILADDDDWGEMISTPQISTATNIPPLEVHQPNQISPASFTTTEAMKETARREMPRPVTLDNTPTRISADGIKFKDLQHSVRSNVVESLSQAFKSGNIEKEQKATTSTYTTDDLDPWGSPSLGNSAQNNNTSSLEALKTNTVLTSQPTLQSSVSEPDPSESYRIPENRDSAPFDNLDINAFTASNISIQTPTVPAPQTTGSSADPWASVDFSFFDAPATPVATAKSKSTLSHVGRPKKSVGFSIATSQAKPTQSPLSQVIAPKSSIIPAHKSAFPPVRGDERSNTENEQDKIVADIIKGLPDLSYMLRR